MLDAILSIAGSSHQGHEHFGEISRGKQCSFMSFSTLLCAQSRVSNAALGYCYSRQNFNQRRQDVVAVNAIESQRIPDRDTLSLIYLTNQACSTVQSPAIEVTEQNKSPIELTKSPSEANN